MKDSLYDFEVDRIVSFMHHASINNLRQGSIAKSSTELNCETFDGWYVGERQLSAKRGMITCANIFSQLLPLRR